LSTRLNRTDKGRVNSTRPAYSDAVAGRAGRIGETTQYPKGDQTGLTADLPIANSLTSTVNYQNPTARCSTTRPYSSYLPIIFNQSFSAAYPAFTCPDTFYSLFPSHQSGFRSSLRIKTKD